jgi:hypothetical protein
VDVSATADEERDVPEWRQRALSRLLDDPLFLLVKVTT